MPALLNWVHFPLKRSSAALYPCRFLGGIADTLWNGYNWNGLLHHDQSSSHWIRQRRNPGFVPLGLHFMRLRLLNMFNVPWFFSETESNSFWSNFLHLVWPCLSVLNSVVFIITFLTTESWLLACFMHSMENRLARITLRIKCCVSQVGSWAWAGTRIMF